MSSKNMVCATCGSENILVDAYAAWDFDQQGWVLVDTFAKGAYCEDCDGECAVEIKEVGNGTH